MKVYLDLYFLINYILDISILIGVSKVQKIIVKKYRLILGSLFGSFSILLLFVKVSDLLLFIIKFIISLIMIIITFGFYNIIKNLVYFYLISIIIGGSMYLLDLSFDYTNRSYFLNIITLCISSPLIIYYFVKDYVSTRLSNSIKYRVIIKYNNNVIDTYGIIDTGNCLVDPYKKRGVVLINSNIDIKSFIFVPYRTIDNNGLIKCFIPDKLVINNKEINNCLVGINNNISICGCNCILPSFLLEVL